MNSECGLVYTFFSAQFGNPYSIIFVQVTLSRFSKFKMIVGMSLPCFADKFFFVPTTKKIKKKRFLIAKLLRIYYVRSLSVSCRMNVRTSSKMLGVHR